ncbi:MAG: hypothetical protein JWN76_2295 [Chitinophagaceae bacterium]|nr:hypothetical protein [Chitinophagaceae bacterium]
MKKLTSILAIVLAISLCSGTSYGQWSHRKKDAVIGGVGGAVLGGIVGHGKGALIGGVAGAGAGYLIGKHKDRPYRTTTYAYAPAYVRPTYAHKAHKYKYKHKRH